MQAKKNPDSLGVSSIVNFLGNYLNLSLAIFLEGLIIVRFLNKFLKASGLASIALISLAIPFDWFAIFIRYPQHD